MIKLKELIKESKIELGKVYTDKDKPPFKTAGQMKEELLKESAPIDDLEYSFRKTPDYKKALRTWKKIEDNLYDKFIKHVKQAGYEEGGTDEDMTWGVIKSKMVSEW